jgi:hypothetical protein
MLLLRRLSPEIGRRQNQWTRKTDTEKEQENPHHDWQEHMFKARD